MPLRNPTYQKKPPMKKTDSLTFVTFLALVGLCVFIWQEIIFAGPAKNPRLYFLDVGQGDSELLLLPGGVKILTDAGPSRQIIQSLGEIKSIGNRYIDLAVITHPQTDHFNGFNFLLDQYKFGAFIFNGRDDSPGVTEWKLLVDKIKAKKIPLLTMEAGDSINYENNSIKILSPDSNYIQSGELNDTAIVQLVKTTDFTALFSSDIGSNVENYLLSKSENVKADILKVAHHGSKYSSGETFLRKVAPKIAAIEVGVGNRYGHPTEEALLRLGSVVNKIFRTDKNGTIEMFAENGILKVLVAK